MRFPVRILISVLACGFILGLPQGSEAKKKKKASKEPFVNYRVQNLSADEREMWNALTKKQRSNIEKGKVEEGYNAWMVELALGKPYYRTEHHPTFTDYEEVWLYTKTDIDEKNTEKKIIDRQTNWPTIHKTHYKKVCQLGDFFLLFDRGVVNKIEKDTSNKTYGSCKIETGEEFLPILDGKQRKR